MVAALALIAVVLTALWSPTSRAQAPGGVDVDFDGFDQLVPNADSTATITLTLDDTSGVAADDPVRARVTLERAGAPLAGEDLTYDAGGVPTAATTDDDGTFLLPVAGDPAFTGDDLTGGLDVELGLSLPAASYEISVQLIGGEDVPASVDRLFGDNRFATAAAISRQFFPADVEVVYIATGANFPDALAGGPAAFLDAAPVLLVGSDIPEPSLTELQRLSPERIVILGGDQAVPQAVADQLAGLVGGPANVTRIAGSGRIATAAMIATGAFQDLDVEVAYIATGGAFPDALSGGAAAALERGPVLLTGVDALPQETIDALTLLAPERVVVLGGLQAIGQQVQDALVPLVGGNPANVTRLFGDDRFRTSAAISAATFDPDLVDTAFVATGANFPDALVAVSAAGLAGAPLLLVGSDIPEAVLTELQRLSLAQVYVLGGEQAIPASVETALEGVVSTQPAPLIGDVFSQDFTVGAQATAAPTARPTASATASASPTPTGPLGPLTVDLELPATGVVGVGEDDDLFVTVRNTGAALVEDARIRFTVTREGGTLRSDVYLVDFDFGNEIVLSQAAPFTGESDLLQVPANLNDRTAYLLTYERTGTYTVRAELVTETGMIVAADQQTVPVTAAAP